jgi:hypothetical protein
MDEMREGGARAKTRGALSGAKEKAQEVIGSITGRGDDDEDEDEREDDDRDRARRREDRGVPASRRAPSRR